MPKSKYTIEEYDIYIYPKHRQVQKVKVKTAHQAEVIAKELSEYQDIERVEVILITKGRGKHK